MVLSGLIIYNYDTVLLSWCRWYGVGRRFGFIQFSWSLQCSVLLNPTDSEL